MHPHAYTNDVICDAMGLGQFEPTGVDRLIRLLVKPSFHPEVCVTLEPTRLHVVALRSMLWNEPGPRRLPEFAETTGLLSGDQFERIAATFDRALEENAKERNYITLDGMPISAMRVDGGRRMMFEGQPLELEQRRFVVELLRLAHASASSLHLRNRIAACGQYLDRTFTPEPEPELPNMTHVMVLGTPDDRADYLNQLQRKTAHNHQDDPT